MLQENDKNILNKSLVLVKDVKVAETVFGHDVVALNDRVLEINLKWKRLNTLIFCVQV